MEFRLRIPGPLLRLAVEKAGGTPADLNRWIVGQLSDYVEGRNVFAENGRKGGLARMSELTPEERSALARKAGLAGGRGRPKTAPDSSSD